MKSKRTGKPVFFVVFLLILALTYTAFFGIENYYGDTRKVYVKGANDIRWGIDIRGGVEAVFSPDKEGVDITANDMDAAKAIIETRLVNKNITDYEVYTDNDNHQIIVRFPWAANESDFDAAAAVQELGETALLTFCRNEDKNDVILSGAQDIDRAEAGVNEKGAYVVYLYFTDAGSSKFAAATKELVGSKISIWMDETKISAPTVNTAITNGTAYIDGMAGSKEAKDLADKINAGSLPFALTQAADNLPLAWLRRTSCYAYCRRYCFRNCVPYYDNTLPRKRSCCGNRTARSACGKYRLHFGLLPECGQLYTYRSGHCGYHSVGRRGR